MDGTWCGRTATCRTAGAGDASERILGQLERFAPGERDRIVARHVVVHGLCGMHAARSALSGVLA